jgi:uncharacterized DUF497 family protein
MIVPRAHGGYICSFFSGSNGARILSLRRAVAREIEKRNFKSVRIKKVKKGILELQFSPELPDHKEWRPFYYAKHGQAVIAFWDKNKLKELEIGIFLPRIERMGRVGWLDYYTLLINFFSSSSKLDQTGDPFTSGTSSLKPAGICSLYFGKTSCDLAFHGVLFEKIKNMQAKGCIIDVRGENVELILERFCKVPCKECSRFDCHPFFWRENKARKEVGISFRSALNILAKHLNIPFEKIREAPKEFKKGVVYLTGEHLLIKFPKLIKLKEG